MSKKHSSNLSVTFFSSKSIFSGVFLQKCRLKNGNCHVKMNKKNSSLAQRTTMNSISTQSIHRNSSLLQQNSIRRKVG